MAVSVRFSAIAIALAVVLAGCGGPGVGSPDTEVTGSPATEATGSPTDGTTIPATATETPDDGGTPTPTATTAPTSTDTATPGGTPTGGEDAAADALERHAEAFAAQPGYVAEMTFEVETPNGTYRTNGTMTADLETGERFSSFEQTFGGQVVTVEQYRPSEGAPVTQCVLFGGVCQRQTTLSPEQVDDANETAPGTGQTNLTTLPRFSDEGVVDTELGPLHKYVADGVETLPEDARSGDFGAYRDVHVELFFDEETGLLRQFVYEATIERDDGETMTSRMVITYTDYGAVDVEEPDWYEG